MDKNRVSSINNITSNLHDETNKIYENLMDGDLKEASKSVDTMMESLKHLKTNLKTDEI